MRKTEIDHLLETAIARALGVKPPVKARLPRPSRHSVNRPTRHAA